MKGGRRNSNSREKRRRAVVSSADYGDFVVSDSRRESHRCRPDIADFALISVLLFSSCTVRSFVTTSSDYGRFLSGTSLVTGAILRRSHHLHQSLSSNKILLAR